MATNPNMTGLQGMNGFMPMENDPTQFDVDSPRIDIWESLMQIIMDQELKSFRNNMEMYDDQEPGQNIQNFLRGK